MAYHDDLMAHALALVHAQPQSQLTLRRAVSAQFVRESWLVSLERELERDKDTGRHIAL